MTGLLLQGAALGLSAAMLPGPFQAYVVSEAAQRGWRRTLPVALAPLLSDGPVLVVAFLVLGRVPDGLLQGIRTAGGVFVALLAYRATRALLTGVEPRGGGYGGVWRGAVTNLLNPNPWLFWGLVGAPLVLAAWRAAPPHALGFLGAFYAVMLAATAAVIVAVGAAAGLAGGLRRALLGVSALALAALGVAQVVLGSLALLGLR